ncbi:MAG: hypothetical protein AAGF87_03965 [Bacteroidota bacterium]
MDLSSRIDSFSKKIHQLASKFDRQREENVALAKENDDLKTELDRQRGLIRSLTEKLQRAGQISQETEPASDVSSSELESLSKEEIREQLDFCLSEIDKCIEWLQKQ